MTGSIYGVAADLLNLIRNLNVELLNFFSLDTTLFSRAFNYFLLPLALRSGGSGPTDPEAEGRGRIDVLIWAFMISCPLGTLAAY